MLIVSTCQISASHYNLINFKIRSAGLAQFFAQLFHSVMCSSIFFLPAIWPHLSSQKSLNPLWKSVVIVVINLAEFPPSLTCSPPVANVTSQEAASLFLWVRWHQHNCAAASRASRSCGQSKYCQLAEVSCELNSLRSPLAQRNLTLCLILSDLTPVVCPKMSQGLRRRIFLTFSTTCSCDQQRWKKCQTHST